MWWEREWISRKEKTALEKNPSRAEEKHEKQIHFFVSDSAKMQCGLQLEVKSPSTSSCLVQKAPEYRFNPLLPTCVVGFIWIATALSFLAFQDPLLSIPKNFILYFSFSHPTSLCFSLALIIPLASAPIYCAAPDLRVKILLLYDPGLYINLSLLFAFSCVLLAPLFHKMHL